MHASDMFQCVVLVKRTNKVLRPRKNDEWNLKNLIRLRRASQPGGGVREREGNEGFEKQGGGWERRHFFVLR